MEPDGKGANQRAQQRGPASDRTAVSSDTLSRVQHEAAAWLRRNFPGCSLQQMALKLAEETGELCRAVIKADHMRGDEGRRAISDGCVDVVIIVIGLCNILGLDLANALAETWDQDVHLRDYARFPLNGRTE